MSQPCNHCLQRLAAELPKRGYRLCDVYYSNAAEEMTVGRFAKMLDESRRAGGGHVSRYYRDRAKA